MEELEQLCRKLEHFETPKWAVTAILNKVILTNQVIDPCAGNGILAKTAFDFGYQVSLFDIYNFMKPEVESYDIDFPELEVYDWLSPENKYAWLVKDNTVFMNPPFSKACEFLEKSFELGARKVLCFQRLAWFESAKRREFWDKYPPKTIYLCGDRATCWRHDIPKSKRSSSTPNAYAWFEFERGYNGSTMLDRIYKK